MQPKGAAGVTSDGAQHVGPERGRCLFQLLTSGAGRIAIAHDQHDLDVRGQEAQALQAVRRRGHDAADGVRGGGGVALREPQQGESGLREFAIYEWWIDRFVQELTVAREQGQLLPDVDESEFARVLMAAYTGTQVMSRISEQHADLPARVAVMWRYLLPALATPEARAALEPCRCGPAAI